GVEDGDQDDEAEDHSRRRHARLVAFAIDWSNVRLWLGSRVVLGRQSMDEALRLRAGREPFGEKDFYLEELRGRTVLVALAPRVVAERADLEPLAATVAELMRNGTRVLVWWPAGRTGTERRLLKAIERHGRARRKGKRRELSPVLEVKL